jgi:hypothetical protein
VDCKAVLGFLDPTSHSAFSASFQAGQLAAPERCCKADQQQRPVTAAEQIVRQSGESTPQCGCEQW